MPHNPKADEPIEVQWGNAGGEGDPPVRNLANRGKYGADYSGTTPCTPISLSLVAMCVCAQAHGVICDARAMILGEIAGKVQADGVGLYHAYAQQIRKTNEDRQRGWDEHNAEKAAAAKKKAEEKAHEIAMQVRVYVRVRADDVSLKKCLAACDRRSVCMGAAYVCTGKRIRAVQKQPSAAHCRLATVKTGVRVQVCMREHV